MKDLDNTTEQVGSLKQRELCRRKLPHDYLLVLPYNFQRSNPDATPEQVELYYASEQRVIDFTNNESRELEKAGVYVRRWNRPVTKFYKCSVCGREEYDLKIKK